MQIDWFTLIAQVVNFLILVALLKRFLHGPISNAMQEREDRIRSQLDEVEEKRREAQEEGEAYREKRRELESSRERLLDEARAEAEERRHEIVEAARQEADELQERWRDALRQQKDAFLQEFRRRASHQVCELTSRVLRDLADRELEAQIIDVFIRRLAATSGEDTEAVEQCLREADEGIRVRTAFEADGEVRARIEGALRERVGEVRGLSFETSEDVVCGVELLCDGLKVAWTVDDYLDALTETMSRTIDEETHDGGDDGHRRADNGGEPGSAGA